MIPDSLKHLIKFDKLKKIGFDQCDSYVHKDHRWVLPIIFEYQKMGVLPKPCKLVMFDAHDDGREILQKAKEFIKEEYDKLTTQKVINICRDHLYKLDGDWVKAGMEMGIISNAIVFGVHRHNNEGDYTDHRGNLHYLKSLESPGAELNNGRKLGDLCNRIPNKKIWDDLNWVHLNQKGFEFKRSDEKFLLDIDLDCFAINWNGYYLPWPEEVYRGEFYKKSDNHIPWTGKRFFDGLVKQAGLLTIAMEPNHCGGDEKANIILNDINKFLFDDRLKL